LKFIKTPAGVHSCLLHSGPVGYTKGVQSPKFLTPTPFLLRLNVIRLQNIFKIPTPTPTWTPKWILWTFGSV